MKIRRFDSYGAMEREALALLREHMTMTPPEPHAVLLTGGRTPLSLYDHIRRRPFEVDPSLSIMITDERYVSVEMPESNYGNMREMLLALKIPDESVIRVRTELPLEAAAERYNEDLTAFLRNGIVTLGFLGLGEDGHVASLFSEADLQAGVGRLAIAVGREPGSQRVTVTPPFLRRVSRIVFLAAGPRKSWAVDKMHSAPETLVAGRAVEGVSSVEVWYSKSE
jgi:6-phosphogluconolactonase